LAASDLQTPAVEPAPREPAESSPSLDVLIVAFHTGALLDACLAVLSGFIPAGSRIIVIDNSPEDPSAARAVARTSSAELLSQKGNVGFAAAVNDGLRKSGAEIVLLANPDVVAIEGSFESIERLFEDVPDAGAVSVRLTNTEGALEHCRRRPRRLDFFDAATRVRRFLPARLAGPGVPMVEWDHSDVRAVDNATGALLFLRRAAIADVGMLDERFFMYWEESDWLARARARDWRLLFTPEVSGVHAGRQSSAVEATTHSLLFLESSYRYVRKHFGLGTTVILRLMWVAADSLRLLRGGSKAEAYRHEVKERLLLHLGASRALRTARGDRATAAVPMPKR
jgi:N-acetylglucosaminyl-diphospho-decaprenol L-rhamnosyltransferase